MNRTERLAAKQLDEKLVVSVPPSPPGGWLRQVRTALGMSAAQFAARMGVSRGRVYALEQAEADGTITLNTLQRAAEALDCRVAYLPAPKRGLGKFVEAQAKRKAAQTLQRVDASQSLEAAAIGAEKLRAQTGDLARELMLRKPKDFWDE